MKQGRGRAGIGRRGAPGTVDAELISRLASGAGIALPPGAAGALALHASEMLRWNGAIRLTAITRPPEVAAKHVLDSLFLLPFAPFPGLTLDFGSGAGYPGIPLAIALPEARVCLLESSAKKCAFLSHACALLGLRNAEVVRGRLEKRIPLPIGPFDQIVTRATVSPADAAGLLVPYLAPGGRLFLMTGPGERPRGTGRKGAEEGGDERRVGPGRAARPSGKAEEGPAADGPVRLIRRDRFSLPDGMGEREIAVYAAAGS